MGDPARAPGPIWHALESKAVLEQLDSHTEGLEEAEAEQRLNRNGPNRIPPPKRRSALMRLLSQFHNVLIYVLLVACLITLFLGHWIDSGVIFGVVFLNGVIGFIQEGILKEHIFKNGKYENIIILAKIGE